MAQGRYAEFQDQSKVQSLSFSQLKFKFDLKQELNILSQMARQRTQDLYVLGSNPPTEARKILNYFLLFTVGCFGTYKIHLLLFVILLQIQKIINSHRKEEEGTLFH